MQRIVALCVLGMAVTTGCNCGAFCLSASDCAATEQCIGGSCSAIYVEEDEDPVVVAAADAGTGVPEECTTGPRKGLPRAPPVVNGTRTPSLVGLSAAQQLAVVGWRAPAVSPRAFCSGTLIAERFVLTAAHCKDALGSLGLADTEVVFGQDDSLPQLKMTPTRLNQHPSQDLVILELPSAPSSQLAVAPIPVSLDLLSNADLGSQVENAGYGLTDPDTQQQSGRYFVVEVLQQLLQASDWPAPLDVLMVYGSELRGVCNGDSGGPCLRVSPTTRDVRVLGALHSGEATCVGHDYYTRVDLVRSWVEGIAGPTPGAAVACGSVSSQGSCESQGRVATWCDAGTLRRVTCASTETCTLTSSGARCQATPPAACGTVTAKGQCSNGTLSWCHNEQLLTRSCTRCNETCQLVDSTTGYNCVP